jgi:hypothetical protein
VTVGVAGSRLVRRKHNMRVAGIEHSDYALTILRSKWR